MSTIFPLAIIQGSSGGNELYNRGTTPWTLIGTMETAYEIPDILTFVNLALIANGYEVPWEYDGTTFQHLSGGVVGAKHHALHQGYYWVWNTQESTSAFDGPSSLRASDLNDPHSWPPANQVFIDKDDGDAGNGMGQFTIAETGISPSTSQILFKEFSGYQMTGVFGSTSPAFAIQRIKSDMGCKGPRTIRFAPGFGLIRLTHRGFALFNGVDDSLISEEVRPLLFGNTIYAPIDWARVGQCYSVVVPNPPLYVCACPVPEIPGLTRVFCYDLVRKAWTVLQYANAIACFEAIRDPGLLPTILEGDYDQGAVRRLFAGYPDDDGVAIAGAALLRPVSAGSAQTNAYFRRMVIKVANVVAGQEIAAVVVVGPVATSTSRQIAKTLTVPVDVPLAISAAIPWDSEMDLTMDLGLIGTNARALLEWSGPLLIRGLEYHVKQKPLRRVSMYG